MYAKRDWSNVCGTRAGSLSSRRARIEASSVRSTGLVAAAPSRQALQMGARLAQSDAAEPDATHEELLADEMVQWHSSRDDVPTRVARGDREFVIARHRRDCLGFDQRDFPGGSGPVRVRAGCSEVTVAFEASPCDRPDGPDGPHRVLRLRSDMDRDDFAVPRGGAGHAAVKGV